MSQLISEQDWQRLHNAGFTPREIYDIFNATNRDGSIQNIDINNSAWQSAISNRQVFTARLRVDFKRKHGRDITRKEHDRIVNQWYKKGLKKTPFDWLVEVYHYGKKRMTNYQKARKAQAQKQHRQLRKQFGVNR